VTGGDDRRGGQLGRGCDIRAATRQAIVQLEGEIAWSGVRIEALCHLADEEGPA
jgi:hypothetical protein